MRALLSVHDKTGIVEFARDLVDLRFELISTGGTFAELRDAGLPVIAVADMTGFPEILDGRVKTLHPRVHGGLLARRELREHMDQLREHAITPIDLLASNLYPFAETIAKSGVTEEEAVEQIDIGGPAMIRAASKNFHDVIVVTEPADYASIIHALRQGEVSQDSRRALAAKGFAHVAAYDNVVYEYLSPTSETMPDHFSLTGEKFRELRYGENPQQRAAVYLRPGSSAIDQGVLSASQLSGKELSFNNMVDADAAWTALQRFSAPAATIVKHTVPCGLACRQTIASAFVSALEGDPVSAFGGIVALNRAVDPDTATRMADEFFEVIIAPGFDEEATQILSRKKQLRLLQMKAPEPAPRGARKFNVRVISGALLVQDEDSEPDEETAWQIVTKRQPTEQELRDLRFAWEVVRHVKSNAIVLAKDEMVLGIGAGQPNRVESVCIAVKKAGAKSSGAVLASDAFFPFADGLEEATRAGVSAVIQPGGSVRDQEVIAAADSATIAMIFTGVRHFKH